MARPKKTEEAAAVTAKTRFVFVGTPPNRAFQVFAADGFPQWLPEHTLVNPFSEDQGISMDMFVKLCDEHNYKIVGSFPTTNRTVLILQKEVG
jgi:hypothetical protein